MTLSLPSAVVADAAAQRNWEWLRSHGATVAEIQALEELVSSGKEFIWKGEWSNATTYKLDYAVSWKGSSYISVKEGVGHEPPNAEYWNVLAEKGATGTEGPKGEKGEKGATGERGLTWRGLWSSLTTYKVNDGIDYKGASYISIKEGSNKEPPNAEYWEYLAEKGENGSAGGAFSQKIGDGVTKTFEIEHKLGTRNCTWAIVGAKEPWEDATHMFGPPTVTFPSTSKIKLVFSTAPASESLFVVVQSGGGPEGPKGEKGESGTLAENSVESKHIKDGEVKEADIGENAVTASKIAAGAVGESELAENSVTAAKIAANAVGESEIAENAVGSSEIKENAVGSTEIAEGAVGSTEIAAEAVGSSELAAGAKELFLQLTTATTRKINFGVTEIEFPGATFRSNIKEVEHGLGTTPLAVVATAEDDGRSIGTTSYTATKFSIRAQAVQGESPAAGTKVKAHWIAIG